MSKSSSAFLFGRRLLVRAFLALLLIVSGAATAFADDWVVTRLRGQVMAHTGGQWVQLKRGDVIADDQPIQTGASGRVELVRGKESLALEPNTQIRIVDADGERKTKVVQAFGVVSVEAERRNVQHFSVQTPIMAAVVKGTRFTVYASKGQSRVSVKRGVVQVRDQVHGLVTDIIRGQSAQVGTGKTEVLRVEGPGPRAPYLRPDGTIVPVEEVLAMAGEAEQSQPRAQGVQVKAQIKAQVETGNGNGSKGGLDGGLRGGLDVGGLGVNVGAGGNSGGNGGGVGVNVGAGGGSGGGLGVSVDVGGNGGGNGSGSGSGNGSGGGSGGGGLGVSVDVGGSGGVGVDVGVGGGGGNGGNGGNGGGIVNIGVNVGGIGLGLGL